MGKKNPPTQTRQRSRHNWAALREEFGDAGIVFVNDNKQLIVELNAVVVTGDSVRTIAIWDLSPGEKMMLSDAPFDPNTLIFLAVSFTPTGMRTQWIQNPTDGDQSFDHVDGSGNLIHVGDTWNAGVYYQSKNVDRTDVDHAIADGLRHDDWTAYKDYIDRHGGVIQYASPGLKIVPSSVDAYRFGAISTYHDDGKYDMQVGT